MRHNFNYIIDKNNFHLNSHKIKMNQSLTQKASFLFLKHSKKL